jgi:trigger factor
LVLAEIEGFADDKPLEGAKISQRILEVSPERLAHGLDEVLAGAEVGQPVHTTRTYAADYAEKDLAGKSVEWRATVKEIYTKVLPELDDEFAKDLGDVASLDELREKVHEQLVQRAREEADVRARQGLLDLIVERNPVEVPQSLDDRERELIESEMTGALVSAGIPREAAAERVRNSAEEIRTRAHKRALSSLIVDAIAEQEGIEVSDDELAARVAHIVTRSSGRDRDHVAEHYRSEESRALLKQSMRREKTLDALLERAQSETEKPAGEAPSEAEA